MTLLLDFESGSKPEYLITMEQRKVIREENSIRGPARVTIGGDFSVSQKCYVKFSSLENDVFKLSQFKDGDCKVLLNEERFLGSDLCGVDWGSFEDQRRVLRLFVAPPQVFSYVTIITKRKPVTLLFAEDEGKQLDIWKRSLQSLLYGDRTHIRERLSYQGKTVLLQVGHRNICVIEEAKPPKREATMIHSWDKGMFFDCKVNGRTLHFVFSSPQLQRNYELQLECQKSDFINGKIVPPNETAKRIGDAVSHFIVSYWFTKEHLYETLASDIHSDVSTCSSFYDLNKLEDADTYGGCEQIRQTMCKVYQKLKDLENRFAGEHVHRSFNEEEKFVLSVGQIMQQIRAHSPRPDTLKLPTAVRTDICYKLYPVTESDRTADWTALASQIGQLLVIKGWWGRGC